MSRCFRRLNRRFIYIEIFVSALTNNGTSEIRSRTSQRTELKLLHRHCVIIRSRTSQRIELKLLHRCCVIIRSRMLQRWNSERFTIRHYDITVFQMLDSTIYRNFCIWLIMELRKFGSISNVAMMGYRTFHNSTLRYHGVSDAWLYDSSYIETFPQPLRIIMEPLGSKFGSIINSVSFWNTGYRSTSDSWQTYKGLTTRALRRAGTRAFISFPLERRWRVVASEARGKPEATLVITHPSPWPSSGYPCACILLGRVGWWRE